MTTLTIKRPAMTTLLLLCFVLAACEKAAEPAEPAPNADTAEITLPDEHLIVGDEPIAPGAPTVTPVPSSAAATVPTAPPLYEVQEGALLIRDEESGSYTPDPAFPAALQGQVASVRGFNNAAGRYWIAYDDDGAALAELFPDDAESWLYAPASEEEAAIDHRDWDRQLIDFNERDLVIVDETTGIEGFSFLFVHAGWAARQAVVSDFRIVDVAQVNKALNYLRATAANQGLVAITENGLEIVPSPLPPNRRLTLDESGALLLVDSSGAIVVGEAPQDYLLVEEITVVLSTERPANSLDMFRNMMEESETRHFFHEGRLTVHHYIPERILQENYISGGGDWAVPALGMSQAGILLANPQQLLAHIQGDWRGQLDTTYFPEGMRLGGFYEWYIEGPQRFDRYLLGHDPLHDRGSIPEPFDPSLEAESDYQIRFRIEFMEQ